MQETNTLEKGIATCPSVLAWRMPWTEVPGGLWGAAKLLQLCPTLCNPIDGSPLGSPCPWDSPGKNTGVGCHFLLQCFMGYRVAKSQTRLKQLSIQARTTGLASSLSKILTVLGVEFFFFLNFT